eukprot:CCRYP_007255-RA/>CCRYP_007255-RA protein AED:0.48 eAED:1.00 QI:0/0/0/1/1/1/2/0/170
MQSTTFIAHHRANDFFLSPPRSSYKKHFWGTSLGEKLRAMSSGSSGLSANVASEERIPPYATSRAGSRAGCPREDQKATYFKLTLPNTGNEFKVAVLVSGTPARFLLHVRSAIHACKQMGLDMSFPDAEKAVKTAKLDAETAKEEYTQLRNYEKRRGAIKGMRLVLPLRL